MAVLECCEPARAGEGANVLALRPTTLLPDERAPEMVICLAADRRWLIADRHGVRPLDADTDVHLQGRRWRLRETEPAMPVLRFRASQDEEHVWLELVGSGTRHDFGERSHHQSVLLLARERRADERRGFAPAECGWRDIATLERMLGIDEIHLNIHIHRARRQVQPALCAQGVAAALVERRWGRVRFGYPAFEIESRAGD